MHVALFLIFPAKLAPAPESKVDRAALLKLEDAEAGGLGDRGGIQRMDRTARCCHRRGLHNRSPLPPLIALDVAVEPSAAARAEAAPGEPETPQGSDDDLASAPSG